MNEPIEETYFNWLYSKVASVDVPTPSLTYFTLLRDLHSVEFVWLISGDDNRAEDGLELRRVFIKQAQLDQEPAWMNLGCSVLEMLIALSYKAEFQTEIASKDWFWVFIGNLELADLNDAKSRDFNISEIVGDVLDQFLWRTYRRNGQGGLFPLRKSTQNQREVEVWYQFHAYLDDQEI